MKKSTKEEINKIMKLIICLLFLSGLVWGISLVCKGMHNVDLAYNWEANYDLGSDLKQRTLDEYYLGGMNQIERGTKILVFDFIFLFVCWMVNKN